MSLCIRSSYVFLSVSLYDALWQLTKDRQSKDPKFCSHIIPISRNHRIFFNPKVSIFHQDEIAKRTHLYSNLHFCWRHVSFGFTVSRNCTEPEMRKFLVSVTKVLSFHFNSFSYWVEFLATHGLRHIWRGPSDDQFSWNQSLDAVRTAIT